MKLSRDLQISLSVAMSEAGRLGHEYAGLEHILYALTFDEETSKVLRSSGADLNEPSLFAARAHGTFRAPGMWPPRTAPSCG